MHRREKMIKDQMLLNKRPQVVQDMFNLIMPLLVLIFVKKSSSNELKIAKSRNIDKIAQELKAKRQMDSNAKVINSKDWQI